MKRLAILTLAVVGLLSGACGGGPSEEEKAAASAEKELASAAEACGVSPDQMVEWKAPYDAHPDIALWRVVGTDRVVDVAAHRGVGRCKSMDLCGPGAPDLIFNQDWCK